MPEGEGREGAGALQNWSTDTVRGALFALTPPQSFDIHNSNAGEKWKEFEQAWKNYYEVAPETQSRTGSNIAYVIGAKAPKVFATFTDWASDTDQI